MPHNIAVSEATASYWSLPYFLIVHTPAGAPVSPSGPGGGTPTPTNPGAQFRVDQYIIEIQSSLTALWLECRDCKVPSRALGVRAGHAMMGAKSERPRVG